MQMENVSKGDAKTFRVQILTPTQPLDLTGYASCQMDLYEMPYDFDLPPIISLHSSDHTKAIFYDRSQGIVEYYLLSSQTSSLVAGQYAFKMKVTKDSEHVYTFHEGAIDIKP